MNLQEIDAVELALLEKNALALRNTADAMLAQVARIKKSATTGPVSKKAVQRKIALTTRILSNTRKPR